MQVFSIDDVFTAGLGFDIAGAVLVARGLLPSPKQHHLRAAHGFGISPGAYAGIADDYADAVFGLSALVLAFAFSSPGTRL